MTEQEIRAKALEQAIMYERVRAERKQGFIATERTLLHLAQVFEVYIERGK